ncbi:hypothetical protein B0H66DRAFT_615307 [Apodospora peruviana]|uniref:Uncharacterized protein n=1 Tax=Apodospora peruviana TaxID=516989 RepID=A0AAE0IHT6_9PEZI|nr:hypothetical protein B0H66DRAFT_615307 [Apodospora peruviana]
MKTSFFSVLVTLVVFQTASAPSAEASAAKLTPLPDGLPDDIYAGDINDDGTTTWKFLSPANATAPPSIEKRQGDFGVHCDGNHFVQTDHRFAALNDLGNLCGSGRFFNSRSISVQHNTVTAYACNYQAVARQWCYHDTIVNNLNSVSNTCGWSVAGWWSNCQGISSWGFAPTGVLFC